MDKDTINFKEFDSFIQKSLEKYFYTEPWEKLYERTGKLHKDIISDKPTIPDLIIYNKPFNKSHCFYSSSPYSYIKFPRMRFILRPKFRKEYNPSDTFGKSDETLFYMEFKDKNIENIENKEKEKENEHNIQSELPLEKINNTQNNEIEEIKELPKENLIDIKKSIDDEEDDDDIEEDEDEPEWANDNVKDFDEEIKFKAIPKTIEEKLKEDIELIPDSTNKKDENINTNNQISIDIDNFFANENTKDVKENNRFNNKGLFDESKNKNNKDNAILNKKKSNEFFDIFDEDNKFKNLYLEGDDQNENNNISDNNKNAFNFNNPNIRNPPMNIQNNRNLFNNKIGNVNQRNIYNIYNNNNFNLINLNNVNLQPFNNPNIQPNNYFYNIPQFNNGYLRNNNIPYNNAYNNMNEKEIYIKNLNNMIYRYNLQNSQRINQINNFNNNLSNNYNFPGNYNINNFQRRNIILNPQNIPNNPFIYKNSALLLLLIFIGFLLVIDFPIFGFNIFPLISYILG